MCNIDYFRTKVTISNRVDVAPPYSPVEEKCHSLNFLINYVFIEQPLALHESPQHTIDLLRHIARFVR